MSPVRFLAARLLVLASSMLPVAAQTWIAENGNGTFTNPLFFDEFSDPDLIRVGADFYLTGTTMHSMPGLPVLHSRDLVNWTFLSYAIDKLDLGPSFRLEGGRNEYGRGIWAPCFRYHKGTFYIFSNVNGQTTQLFRATNPKGPWTRTPMKRSMHDLSVLFDDDGNTYVVWGLPSRVPSPQPTTPLLVSNLTNTYGRSESGVNEAPWTFMPVIFTPEATFCHAVSSGGVAACAKSEHPHKSAVRALDARAPPARAPPRN